MTWPPLFHSSHMDRDCTLINTGGPSVATLAVNVFRLLLRGLVVPGVNTIIRGISAVSY